MLDHLEQMKQLVAFTETSLGTEFPSPFGSSVVDRESGAVIAQAYDTVMRECDPTNHAEVNAIRLATRQLQRLSLKGTVLYSTCEPCPMCMSAAIWAEVDLVVYGASTMEDATLYWPQPSPVTPQELVDRTLVDPKCELIAHLGRDLCQDLFRRVDATRKRKGLDLPPHR